MRNFFMIAFMFSAAFSYSQTNVSLQGGINRSTVTADPPYIDFEYIDLIHAGLNISYKLDEKLDFILLLEYAQKGNGNNNAISSFFSPPMRMHYLDLIPVLEYKVVRAIGLYAGANAGYLFRIEDKSQTENWEETDRDGFNEFDIGGVLGTRIYFGNIGIHVHWNKGLKDLRKDGAYGFRNNVFQLGMSIYL